MAIVRPRSCHVNRTAVVTNSTLDEPEPEVVMVQVGFSH
jgi:hypothetical protein